MRLFTNIPRRITKIKLVLTEEVDGQVKKEKEYTFKRSELEVFDTDYKMNAYINQCIAPDWPNKINKKRGMNKKYKDPEYAEKVNEEETEE